MDSIRQQKINSQLHKEFSDFLLKEGNLFCRKSLVTVTGIRITPDLSIARVHVSIFATPDKKAIITHFSENATEIRFLMGKRIRNQMRHVPEFHFFLDDSLDQIERIDLALKK